LQFRLLFFQIPAALHARKICTVVRFPNASKMRRQSKLTLGKNASNRKVRCYAHARLCARCASMHQHVQTDNAVLRKLAGSGRQMSMLGRGPSTIGPRGGGGGGALLVVAAVGLFLYNLPTVVAIAAVLASNLWTLIASIAVGAPLSIPIAFLAVPLGGDFGFPAFSPAIGGIIAGAAIACLRMTFRTKEKYDPLLSSLFSVEGLSEGGWQFVWRFLADVSVGYLVMMAFGMIHVVATTDHQFTISIHEIGGAIVSGGGHGGGAGDGSGFLSELLVVLAALLFAALLLGAIWGAAIGAILGLGLCSTHVLRGMAQGATIHVLLGRGKTEKLPKNFIGYVLLGAFSGAVEGALVGVLCGLLTDWGFLLNKAGSE
jgi:hypothetical protein